jgi:hypothetical protein
MEIYYMPCFGMGGASQSGRPRLRLEIRLLGGGSSPVLELLEARFRPQLTLFRHSGRAVAAKGLESLASDCLSLPVTGQDGYTRGARACAGSILLVVRPGPLCPFRSRCTFSYV